jgi:hypothetical protein
MNRSSLIQKSRHFKIGMSLWNCYDFLLIHVFLDRFFNEDADDYIFKLEYWKLCEPSHLEEHLEIVSKTEANQYVSYSN